MSSRKRKGEPTGLNKPSNYHNTQLCLLKETNKSNICSQKRTKNNTSDPLQLVRLNNCVGLGQQSSACSIEVESAAVLLWIPMCRAINVAAATLEAVAEPNFLVAAATTVPRLPLIA